MMSPILLFSYLVVEFLFKKWVSRNRYGFPNEKKKINTRKNKQPKNFFPNIAALYYFTCFFFFYPTRPKCLWKNRFFLSSQPSPTCLSCPPHKNIFFFKLQKGFFWTPPKNPEKIFRQKIIIIIITF